MVSTVFVDRPIKKPVLFDVDDTLTAPRQVCPMQCAVVHSRHRPYLQSVSPEMTILLRALRKKVAIGVVSGPDPAKASEQLSVLGSKGVFPFPALCHCTYVLHDSPDPHSHSDRRV